MPHFHIKEPTDGALKTDQGNANDDDGYRDVVISKDVGDRNSQLSRDEIGCLLFFFLL